MASLLANGISHFSNTETPLFSKGFFPKLVILKPSKSKRHNSRLFKLRADVDYKPQTIESGPLAGKSLSSSSSDSDQLHKFLKRDYKWGFNQEIDSFTIPKGLSEETIRLISSRKNEPDWMLEFRLNSYKKFCRMTEPKWSDNSYPAIHFQDICYYSEPKKKPTLNSLDEADPELIKYFDKLGVPLNEQNRLANVAVDAVLDSVSIATTHRKTLEKAGVIFCSISEAIKEYPDLIRKYLGKVVPAEDNFYAALNSAVFSDGSFVYIPKDTRSPMQISTYFRINAMETGQFERTLIVAEDRGFVEYLEGCTAPSYDTNQLHAAVVELYCHEGAEIKYSTVQNWYAGDEEGKGGIFNFVTKRGLCAGCFTLGSGTLTHSIFHKQMGVLGESWCFCNGGGKSERMKAAIFSGKGTSMARIALGGSVFGTGFFIHRNLLLTTHVNLPSVAAAESAEIRLQNGVGACLFPHRFFITSSILDVTIVGLDAMDGDSNPQAQHFQYLKTCSKLNLDLGSVVYLLGYGEKQGLTVGEGKVVIATDNLIKMSTDGVMWNPGSAGFDVHGNLAFMVCDPMKLATSPNSKSSSTSSFSSSSWKKDLPMQFGIPIPIICDWLNQHWEGNLDELTKPKLPLIRLMSVGQKSEHSCASFTMRQVFKSTEAEDDRTPSSSNVVSKPEDLPGASCSPAANTCQDETPTTDPHTATHVQGIPTPEIYESPKLSSVPFRNKESTQIQLLDINFPPRITKAAVSPQPARKLLPNWDENCVKQLRGEEHLTDGGHDIMADAEIASTGSINGAESEVQLSSFPLEVSEVQNGCSSEGETTMYSAETAESRNYPSPREGKFYQVGRSQSRVNYNRWGAVQRNPIAQRRMMEKQRSFMQGRKVYSQAATSQRSNDYFSPTVSSIMKKRNNLETRQSAVHSSAKWTF